MIEILRPAFEERADGTRGGQTNQRRLVGTGKACPGAPSFQKGIYMKANGSVVAVFAAHHAVETAVKRLAAAGFEMKNLSVVGRGYQSEETAVGFYCTGEKGKFWGARGTFWGDQWKHFLGGAFLTTPHLGPVVIVGRLAPIAICAVESAAAVRGLSAVGTALHGIGIPADSTLTYEAALKADGFLVMAHGSAATLINAKVLLGKLTPLSLDWHAGGKTIEQIARFG